ncbi:MAG: RsmD family RNA methyltransferase [Bacillus sp. (in: firmicutes)]
MIEKDKKTVKYLYTYACHEDEVSLCRLEMRSLFGFDNKTLILESPLKINPSRSPFIKERIDSLYCCGSLKELVNLISDFKIVESTFKVVFIENPTNRGEFPFDQKRKIAREIGSQIQGTVDLICPKVVFALMPIKDGWVFGEYHKSESIWLQHQLKPNNYSTALSTRVARAVVNIAVPHPFGMKVIDPCCGIGTVLVEALSMGIDIIGSDRNPLVTGGARENIAHFGLAGEVKLADMRNIENHYDIAIIDMPYNLCSVLPADVQLEMLRCARLFADKAVIVTVEEIDSFIHEAGFSIKDRGIAKKGRFKRQVLVCE